jgi:hypothetical protein
MNIRLGASSHSSGELSVENWSRSFYCHNIRYCIDHRNLRASLWCKSNQVVAPINNWVSAFSQDKPSMVKWWCKTSRPSMSFKRSGLVVSNAWNDNIQRRPGTQARRHPWRIDPSTCPGWCLAIHGMTMHGCHAWACHMRGKSMRHIDLPCG